MLRYEIWDTAGQERFHSLAPMYYRNAQAAVVVYDVTKASSLEKAKSWVKELQRQANPNIVIALAGNKVDLVQGGEEGTAASSSKKEGGLDVAKEDEDEEADDATATPEEQEQETNGAESLRAVPKEEAQAYAAEAGLLFFETSAKTGEGVVEIFTEIGEFQVLRPHSDDLLTVARPHPAKKIPIEHILSNSRGASGGRAGSASQGQGDVALDANAPKPKDACNC